MTSSHPAALMRTAALLLAQCLTVALVTGCSGGSSSAPGAPASSASAAKIATRMEAASPTEATGAAGTNVTAPVVRVLDAGGSPVAGVSVTFFVVSGGGTVANTTAVTDAAGLASAGRWTLGLVGGPQEVSARATGLSALQFTATAQTFARISLLAGNQQAAPVRSTLPLRLSVRVSDQSGNALPGTAVSFRITGGYGGLQAGDTLTDSSGNAQSGAWTLGLLPGPQQVTVLAGGAQATFDANALPLPASPQPSLAVVSTRDGNEEIYLVEANGSNLRRLTNSAARDNSPAWSPDGNRLAFTSDRGELKDHLRLYAMAADGSGVVPLAPGYLAFAPGWSPDGTTIAFSAQLDGQLPIATVGLNAGGVTPLIRRPGWHSMSAWSPDGQKLAFVSDWVAYDFVYDIYTMNRDGTGILQLTNGFGLAAPSSHFSLHPAWSPDGRMLAYVSAVPTAIALPAGSGSISGMRFSVRLMSADGAYIKELAWSGDVPWLDALDTGALSWSPDGRGIAYTFVDCIPQTLGRCSSRQNSVKYVTLDGSENRTILTEAADPAWHP